MSVEEDEDEGSVKGIAGTTNDNTLGFHVRCAVWIFYELPKVRLLKIDEDSAVIGVGLPVRRTGHSKMCEQAFVGVGEYIAASAGGSATFHVFEPKEELESASPLQGLHWTKFPNCKGGISSSGEHDACSSCGGVCGRGPRGNESCKTAGLFSGSHAAAL